MLSFPELLDEWNERYCWEYCQSNKLTSPQFFFPVRVVGCNSTDPLGGLGLSNGS
jgi:hypothetical protein